ncbi:hypothetical protein SGL43_06950 [Streptomyces globisporus]|uniref:Uncharacterized protein n=1 Tax=Streptomyces globisporus TaxID=1908 RepID=A0ABM9H8C2_STRGL|nr:hypothetical protein SGL43_06950 [Streptomyces globisporus]
MIRAADSEASPRYGMPQVCQQPAPAVGAVRRGRDLAGAGRSALAPGQAPDRQG